MKFIAIAALLGASEAVQLTNQEKLYLEMGQGKVIEKGPDFNGWHAHLDGFPGTIAAWGNYMDPYAREIPVRFQGDFAQEGYTPVDKFTQNVLKNWAIEGIDDKKGHPQPNGKFYLT